MHTFRETANTPKDYVAVCYSRASSSEQNRIRYDELQNLLANRSPSARCFLSRLSLPQAADTRQEDIKANFMRPSSTVFFSFPASDIDDIGFYER